MLAKNAASCNCKLYYRWCNGKTVPLQTHYSATTVPLQTWTAREDSKFLCSRQGCQPYAPAAFTPQEIFLVLISVRTQGHSAAGRMKNSNGTIGNRTRDLPACSTVPQRTAPPRTLDTIRNTVRHCATLPQIINGSYMFRLQISHRQAVCTYRRYKRELHSCSLQLQLIRAADLGLAYKSIPDFLHYLVRWKCFSMCNSYARISLHM